jgi:hypothetical protein
MFRMYRPLHALAARGAQDGLHRSVHKSHFVDKTPNSWRSPNLRIASETIDAFALRMLAGAIRCAILNARGVGERAKSAVFLSDFPSLLFADLP